MAHPRATAQTMASDRAIGGPKANSHVVHMVRGGVEWLGLGRAAATGFRTGPGRLDLDPATPLPEEWLARAAAARPGIPLPVDMSDGVPNPVTFQPWDGSGELAVDRAIGDTRGIIYPLHGLDAHDPRE